MIINFEYFLKNATVYISRNKGSYLTGINFSGNLFSRISFFRNFAEKWELIFAGFRDFILNENSRELIFAVEGK